MRRLLIIGALVASAGLLAGCPRPIGACQYSDDRVDTGAVRVTSAEQDTSGTTPRVRVTVEGFFNRTLSFPVGEFERCFTGAGHEVGDEVQGSMMPGGPCPPQYTILDCRPYQT